MEPTRGHVRGRQIGILVIAPGRDGITPGPVQRDHRHLANAPEPVGQEQGRLAKPVHRVERPCSPPQRAPGLMANPARLRSPQRRQQGMRRCRGADQPGLVPIGFDARPQERAPAHDEPETIPDRSFDAEPRAPRPGDGQHQDVTGERGREAGGPFPRDLQRCPASLRRTAGADQLNRGQEWRASGHLGWRL